MVHSTRDCILTNKFILNFFVSFALIVIVIYFSGVGYVSASTRSLQDNNDNNNNPVGNDEFHEDLYIKPLTDGKLLAHFQFVTTYRRDLKNLRWENKIQILPLSIVDLITSTGASELHFSLTKGNWNYKNWGYAPRSSPPGAQIRASFNKHSKNLDDTWRRLTNSLAGEFCASLISANEQTLVMPKLSFSAENQLRFGSNPSEYTDFHQHITNDTQATEHVMYTNLPEETLCTGNLSPWKKLLPCNSNSGLASLLNAINLFKSSYSSLAIDLQPKRVVEPKTGGSDHVQAAHGPNSEKVQLRQSITVVFNPLQQFEGKQTWSLAKIFGTSIKSNCPLADHSLIHVDITDLNDKSKLYPQDRYREWSLNMGIANGPTIKRNYATFDLLALIESNIRTDKNTKTTTTQATNTQHFNMGIKQNQLFKKAPFSSRRTSPVEFRTHLAGLGSFDGTIVATITNSLPEPIRITYMDMVPHFMRLYLHTLNIRLTKTNQELKPDNLNFALSRDDITPSLLEFSLLLPANSETQISYDFERAFLKLTAYKPDANKGVLLSSAMITIPGSKYSQVMENLALPLCFSEFELKLSSLHAAAATNETRTTSSTVKVSVDHDTIDVEGDLVRIYARPLLVILPTPDFSMPYNVLCLVCTVLVFAFGPIYNITIRRPIVGRKKKKNDVT